TRIDQPLQRGDPAPRPPRLAELAAPLMGLDAVRRQPRPVPFPPRPIQGRGHQSSATASSRRRRNNWRRSSVFISVIQASLVPTIASARATLRSIRLSSVSSNVPAQTYL